MDQSKKQQGKTPGIFRSDNLGVSAFEAERLRVWCDFQYRQLGMGVKDCRERLRYYGANLEAYKKSLRGPRGPGSAVAVSVGAAFRRIQIEDRKIPSGKAVSCLTALIAGGYYCDFTGTIGLALATLSSQAAIEVLKRYLCPDLVIPFAMHGFANGDRSTTWINDYNNLLWWPDNSALALGDDQPFEAAFDTWTTDRDMSKLPNHFGLAISTFSRGDVIAGIDLLRLIGLSYLSRFQAFTELACAELAYAGPVDEEELLEIARDEDIPLMATTLHGLKGQTISWPMVSLY